MNKNKSALRLTKRDLALLAWVNAFGFVTADLVARYWQVARSTVYGRLRQLMAQGYLRYRRIFHGFPGVYSVTRFGANASGSPLAPLRWINRATYYHDLSVVALSMKLSQQYSGQFMSERQLRHDLGLQGVGQPGHIPDGVLVYAQQRVAVEVELHKKGRQRREKILKQYRKQFEYDAVWYFCGTRDVENQLNTFVDAFDFLKVERLPKACFMRPIEDV